METLIFFLCLHCRQAQYILEAFGNAATVQNSNSSRFAMYYEVYFSPEFKLSGGKLYNFIRYVAGNFVLDDKIFLLGTNANVVSVIWT